MIDVCCCQNSWQSHPSQIFCPALSTSFLLHPIPLLYISQMPASGYSGSKFPDLSMSEQNNGFQPWLLLTANFSSGMNDSPLYSEICQLSAQLIVVEQDLAVEK